MNAERPLVSIVIPCFNYGRYLGEAIESALGQTYQSVEVIVVDDGSSDDTLDVARRYPVHIIEQSNSGVCLASNAGFRAARGEFALRLDADDRLDSTYVEETLHALQGRPDAAFAYTEIQYFGAGTGGYPVEIFDRETIVERNYVHVSALMRRASFDRAGGYNPNMSRARYEDWDLWLTFVENGETGVLVPKPLLLYRQHPGASRVSFDLLSVAGLRREIRMAAQLHDNHRALFPPRALAQRLRRLPDRLLRREVSPRFAGLLLGFYGVMLLRIAFGRAQWPRARRDALPARAAGPSLPDSLSQQEVPRRRL